MNCNPPTSLFTNQKYMKRCLQLASLGLGTTYPNPLVGSVVVYENRIIGEGWHKKAGSAHAEVNAIDNVKDKDLLKNSTLYVNLEPCNHYGKTPPCTQKIIESKIPSVVIGTPDKNPIVNCQGIEFLKKAGIQVQYGVLEKECTETNKRFFTFQERKRPYIILKWSENEWGQIGSSDPALGSVSISNSYSRQLSHLWRSEEQSILVGKNTVLQDNPKLNTRAVEGSSPVKIILDPSSSILTDAHIFHKETPTYIFTRKITKRYENATLIEVDYDSPEVLKKVLESLYHLEIQSILVEGGRFTLQKFIELNLWDEIRLFKSTTQFPIPSPIYAPSLPRDNIFLKSKKSLIQDDLYIYINQTSVLE